MAHYQSRLLGAFSCLGADCPDTCCKGWYMQMDAVRLDKYREEAPELLGAVTAAPADVAEKASHVMCREEETGYCVQFKEGLCRIHAAYGPEFLGDACYFYPRSTRALGSDTYMTASMSCPEVARLALVEGMPFTYAATADPERLPVSVTDYVPDGLDTTQARQVMDAFVAVIEGAEESVTVETLLARIVSVAHSLQRLPVASWPEAVPFYLKTADARLPSPEADAADPFRLLTALAGLLAGAPPVYRPRIERLFAPCEEALGVTVDWKSLQVLHTGDDPVARYQGVLDNYSNNKDLAFSSVLRRWLTGQIISTFFPFGGLGNTPAERAVILAVRYAMLRLVLRCAAVVNSNLLKAAEIAEYAQILARLLDHLADPTLSLAIYAETGWLREPRLLGLLQG